MIDLNALTELEERVGRAATLLTTLRTTAEELNRVLAGTTAAGHILAGAIEPADPTQPDDHPLTAVLEDDPPAQAPPPPPPPEPADPDTAAPGWRSEQTPEASEHNRRLIVDTVRELGEASPRAIAARLDVPASRLGRPLTRLVEAGELKHNGEKRTAARYTIAGETPPAPTPEPDPGPDWPTPAPTPEPDLERSLTDAAGVDDEPEPAREVPIRDTSGMRDRIADAIRDQGPATLPQLFDRLGLTDDRRQERGDVVQELMLMRGRKDVHAIAQRGSDRVYDLAHWLKHKAA